MARKNLTHIAEQVLGLIGLPWEVGPLPMENVDKMKSILTDVTNRSQEFSIIELSMYLRSSSSKVHEYPNEWNALLVKTYKQATIDEIGRILVGLPDPLTLIGEKL